MKTVIEMAREAGFFPERNWDHTNWHAAGFNKSFERFAELVRADEREACAKVVEGIVALNEYAYADECAGAIRARNPK